VLSHAYGTLEISVEDSLLPKAPEVPRQKPEYFKTSSRIMKVISLRPENIQNLQSSIASRRKMDILLTM